jgi:hypothetical protein
MPSGRAPKRSALRDRLEVQEFARKVSELATFDPHLYRVEELCLPAREPFVE